MKVGRESLLESALNRLKGFDIRIVAKASIARQMRAHLKGKLGKAKAEFFCEPEGRDTAAAVGFGIRCSKALHPKWVAVVSADHWIPHTKAYQKFLQRVGTEIAKFPDALFVCGSSAASKPATMHSQLGWVVPKVGAENDFSFGTQCFVEKPSADRLKSLTAQGALINAGMFFGRWETFEAAFKAHYPEVLNSKVKYSSLERQPVDRAIFERFENVRVIPLGLQWEDLGTWEEWDRHGFGRAGASVKSAIEGAHVICRTSTLKQVSVVSRQDLVIIEEEGQLLILDRKEAAQLKTHLERMGE
jgi:mannose-1-phosphate guanylyltransferase